MKPLKKSSAYLLALGSLAIILACGTSSSLTGKDQDTTEPDGTSAIINVVVEDFSFSLDTSQTEAGAVTFVVLNNGALPHDFAIRGSRVMQKTPMIASGESARLTIELEPGTYTYFCTVAGHEDLGMSGTFTVTSG